MQKFARIDTSGYQNAFIGGYKGASTGLAGTSGEVSFGRTAYTGTGTGLPRGSVIFPHRNPEVSLIWLIRFGIMSTATTINLERTNFMDTIIVYSA